MLGTGLSSLRALQRALDTTAHNIANVSTEGYTASAFEFATRTPQSYGRNWVGSGVDATQVRRIYDQFLASRAAARSGNLARLDAFAIAGRAPRQHARRHDQRHRASCRRYTDALNEVSSTPSSIPARQVLLAQGRR
jgi:flagellar hook-associated protein 1 FlgK